MRFKLKHISETYSDPTASICQIGAFDGPNTTYGDLVFVREGIDSIRTYMNSTVLREVLLSNPNLLTQTTGVVCLDIDKYNELINTINQLKDENAKLNNAVPVIKRKKRTDLEEVK